jgi:hypothetical protein
MRPHCLDLAVITVLPDSSVITGTEDLDGVMARSCSAAVGAAYLQSEMPSTQAGQGGITLSFRHQ